MRKLKQKIRWYDSTNLKEYMYTVRRENLTPSIWMFSACALWDVFYMFLIHLVGAPIILACDIGKALLDFTVYLHKAIRFLIKLLMFPYYLHKSYSAFIKKLNDLRKDK